MKDDYRIESTVIAETRGTTAIGVWADGSISRYPVIGWVVEVGYHLNDICERSAMVSALTGDGPVNEFEAGLLEYREGERPVAWSCPDCAFFENYAEALAHARHHLTVQAEAKAARTKRARDEESTPAAERLPD